MSRSRRKTPIMGHCGESDKLFKVGSHRATRRRVRSLVRAVDDVGARILPKEREMRNIWADSNKDGKGYFAHFDPEDVAQFMRK